MGIIYQKDKRTGITYVYESKAVWDKEKQQSRAKRRLIGKLDPETGAIVPTDGRGRKRSPYSNPDTDTKSELPHTIRELKEEVSRLRDENKLLMEKIKELESN